MSPTLRKMIASKEFVMPHYTRYLVRDRPGILAAISQVLATYAINVDAVLQLPGHSREALPFAITLEPSNQQALDAAMAEIGKLHFLAQPPLCLPIGSLHSAVRTRTGLCHEDHLDTRPNGWKHFRKRALSDLCDRGVHDGHRAQRYQAPA